MITKLLVVESPFFCIVHPLAFVTHNIIIVALQEFLGDFIENQGKYFTYVKKMKL